ncbi:MAG TPA: UUP1 family membrane protein [Candidatus Binatia bacterium]|nr:UUP1 family membrane protein [Candidatus Binatia bacterium]
MLRFATTLALVLVAVAPAASARRPAHPLDDEDVVAGTEAVERGRAGRPPAVAYWHVRAALRVAAGEGPMHVALLVPLSDGRQDVLTRRAAATGLSFRETQQPPNLRAEWSGTVTGTTELAYEVGVRIAEVSVTPPRTPFAPLPAPPDAPGARAPSALVQSAAPAVVRRARAVVGRSTRLDEVLWSLYQHTAAFLPATDPPGPQDAASVLAARRGTSVGRARALAALLRASGVPARLVGGLRLERGGERRATSAWVEAWVGDAWLPLDPAGGQFATLPNTYLALYRGDAPLLVHTRGREVAYEFTVRPTTRRAVEERAAEADAVRVAAGRRPVVRGPGRHRVVAHTAYVKEPVASVVLVADQSVPSAVTDRILGEARAAAIDCVLLTARFESRYFRESYLSALVAENLPLIRQANLVLVATADDAGMYALMELGERGIRLADARVVVAGAMSDPAALMLGSLFYHLVLPGEVVLVRRPAELLPLWEMARANLVDGTPMHEAAGGWGIDAIVLGDAGTRLPKWRRPLMHAWARAVRAQVPLGALTLILILPIVASIVVVARIVVGLETFGMFGPVIVSLAFITTGLWWGTLIFLAIVGIGVVLRMALLRLRLQAVSRLAILITLVAAVMAGLTVVGATLGIGPLLNISIFPMLIMSNVIENFAASQVEFGTRRAIVTAATTLGLSITCYLVVDRGGLQSLVLAYPEILLATVAFDVLLGKWRGLRVLEYVRFLRAVPEAPP